MHRKEAITAFKMHQTSDYHCEVLLVLQHCTKDIAALQDAEHDAQKALDHRAFMIVI